MSQLSFEELRALHERTSELAKTSFRRVDDGFKNANGDGVFIEKRWDKFVLARLDRRAFHEYISSHPGVLEKGSSNREEMMQALQEMVEACGNRIIE